MDKGSNISFPLDSGSTVYNGSGMYHDYVELFKSWFGDNVDQKIIESAIIFWFKDVDCKAENKAVEYLGEY